MAFQIGVMSDSFNKKTIREGLAEAARAGASGVQMYAVSGEMSPENMTDAKIEEIKGYLKEYNLKVSALCGDLGGHGFERAEDNGWKIEKSKQIVDLCLRLDSNIVTTHIGCIPEDENDPVYGIMLDACTELANYANGKGAFFAIETGPEPAALLKTFLDKTPVKGVAVNMDPANLVMVTGDDPVQAVYTLRDYIVHTHAKDGVMLKKSDPKQVYGFFADGGIGDLRLDEFFLEVPLGKGQVPFDGYLSALRDIGYTGYLTVERECGDNPFDDIQSAVEFLQTKI